MCKKRIAVITARADDNEQKEILCGIAEAALAADADTVVYSNIYNHWVEDMPVRHSTIKRRRIRTIIDNVIYNLSNDTVKSITAREWILSTI